VSGPSVELRVDVHLAARLRLVGIVSVVLGLTFAAVVAFGGGATAADLAVALVLFVVPFVWAGWSFLCEARLLPGARVRLREGRLELRLVDPRPFRLRCDYEENVLSLADIRGFDRRRRSMLEVLLLSAMRPRGSWSREALTILAGDRVVELDPAVWPDLPRLHQALEEALAARERAQRGSNVNLKEDVT